MAIESSNHPASVTMERLRESCDVRRQRRSGPGGQHRNKVETGVFILHRPTGLTAEATERRSQTENLRIAWHRLRLQLALRIRRPLAVTAPSDRWQARCRGGRIQVAAGHDELPALLAEALDVLDARDWNAPEAAEWLGCSTSQLVKFLKSIPKAWELLNRQRAARNLGPLQ
jgi:hypothetical protein